MKKFFNFLLHPKKTKLFWLYIVTGILGIILGVMLMPIWDNAPDWVFWKNWGRQIVNLIICACILLYLFCYLLHKIKRRSNGVIQTLMIVEFVVMLLIAVGCVLQQFKVINVGGACAILGVALWCRGVVEIFRAYYHQHGDNMYYPLWYLVFVIFLVSFGVYIFVRPFFTDIQLLWFFIGLLLVISIILIIDGFLAKPEKKEIKKETKKEKSKKKEETEDEK